MPSISWQLFKTVRLGSSNGAEKIIFKKAIVHNRWEMGSLQKGNAVFLRLNLTENNLFFLQIEHWGKTKT